MTEQQAIDLILRELTSAMAKHPDWPSDPIHAAAVLGEEAGETIQAALDMVYDDAPEARLIAEAAQTGAVAIRILMNAGNYK